MIEQLDIVVRSNLPRRHRRLARCIVAWLVTVLMMLAAHGLAAWGRGTLPDGLLIWMLWFSQFGWLFLLYLYGAIFVYAGYLLKHCVRNSLLSIALVLLCFVPILQVVIGLMLCIWIARAARELDIEATWRGLPDSAVARLVGVNYCRGCGYDLTGNKSGVCPECGRDVLARQQ